MKAASSKSSQTSAPDADASDPEASERGDPSVTVSALDDAVEQLKSFFEEAHDELLGTLQYVVGHREDAVDALQDAFVKCWKNRDQIPQVQNLRAWVFRVVINTGRDARTTAWRRRRQTLGDAEGRLPAEGESPVDVMLREEQQRQLAQALDQLRDEEKEVFLLRQNGQLTYEEIGESLKLPLGTVKTRMRRAVLQLKAVCTRASGQD